MLIAIPSKSIGTARACRTVRWATRSRKFLATSTRHETSPTPQRSAGHCRCCTSGPPIFRRPCPPAARGATAPTCETVRPSRFPQSGRPSRTCLAPCRRPTSWTGHVQRARCNLVIMCVRRVTVKGGGAVTSGSGHQPGNGGHPGWWPKEHRAVSGCGEVRWRGCHRRCCGTACGWGFRSPATVVQHQDRKQPPQPTRPSRGTPATNGVEIDQRGPRQAEDVDMVFNTSLHLALPNLAAPDAGFRRVSGRS
jgi:hypothetical protein